MRIPDKRLDLTIGAFVVLRPVLWATMVKFVAITPAEQAIRETLGNGAGSALGRRKRRRISPVVVHLAEETRFVSDLHS